MRLALGLDAHGIACEVAGPIDAAPYRELAAAGIPVRRLALGRGYGRPVRDATALAALVGLLRDGGFDLLHAHAAKAGALGRLAARPAGIPAVYSPHCLPFVGQHSRGRRAVTMGLERLLAPLTATMLCVCEEEREVALAHGLAAPDRAVVVLNGAAPRAPDGPGDPRLRTLRGPHGLLVGAVTVLRDQKGLTDLVAAAPRILAAVPEARIAIVGNGPCWAQLEAQIAALAPADAARVALLSFEGPAARHLRELDIYVLPSRWEALPIGALEAMACGVPQVTSAVGGVPEAVTRDTGVLTSPGDPVALADGVIALPRDPVRRAALARGSVARHARWFGVERMVAATAEVYAATLARAGRVSVAASTGGADRARP